MSDTSEGGAYKNTRAAMLAVLCDKCRDPYDWRMRKAELAFRRIEDYVWHALCSDFKNRMLDFCEQQEEREAKRG